LASLLQVITHNALPADRTAQDEYAIHLNFRWFAHRRYLAGPLVERVPVESAMIGELTGEQIEQLLKTQAIGRIGCHANGLTYIVPVAYVYHDNCVYGHSDEGLKLRLARANPEVCFEVEHIENMCNWQTVIVWGTYEELSGQEADDAMVLLKQLLPTLRSQSIGLAGDHTGYIEYRVHTSGGHGHFYRINLREKSGRFEVEGP
jgi:nitroimidazol reductase NimA-like FMN-containing flavoprotein (pyridoxamine 5'-phosphate oxidase superfamily)